MHLFVYIVFSLIKNTYIAVTISYYDSAVKHLIHRIQFICLRFPLTFFLAHKTFLLVLLRTACSKVFSHTAEELIGLIENNRKASAVRGWPINLALRININASASNNTRLISKKCVRERYVLYTRRLPCLRAWNMDLLITYAAFIQTRHSLPNSRRTAATSTIYFHLWITNIVTHKNKQ